MKKEDIDLLEIEDHLDLNNELAGLLEPRILTPIEELEKARLKDDYTLIKSPFEAGNKETHYIGKILSVQGSEISVSCI